MEYDLRCEICGNVNRYNVITKRLGLDEAGELNSVKCNCIAQATKSLSKYDIDYKPDDHKNDTSKKVNDDSERIQEVVEHLTTSTDMYWAYKDNVLCDTYDDNLEEPLSSATSGDMSNAQSSSTRTDRTDYDGSTIDNESNHIEDIPMIRKYVVPEYTMSFDNYQGSPYIVTTYDKSTIKLCSTEYEIRLDNSLSNSIETVLRNLPNIVKENPSVLTLHPYMQELHNNSNDSTTNERNLEWITKCNINAKISCYKNDIKSLHEPKISGNLRVRATGDSFIDFTSASDKHVLLESVVSEVDCSAKVLLMDTTIGPGASYCISAEATLKNEHVNRTFSECRMFTECEAEMEPGVFLIRRHYDREGNKYFRYEIEITNNNNNVIPMKRLHDIYTRLIDLINKCNKTRFGMISYINKSWTGKLFTMCTHVKDVREVNLEGYTYMVKPDGYCVWIMDYGHSYIVTLPTGSLKILKVFMKSNATGEAMVTEIRRFEAIMCNGHLTPENKFTINTCGYIYIDTIYDQNKKLDVSRPYEEESDINHNVLEDLPISKCFSRNDVVRKQFSCTTQAIDNRDIVNYPTDGILLISKSTSFTFRVKHPTIDARYKNGNMILKTTIGNSVREIEICYMPHSLTHNAIYECVIDTDASTDTNLVIKEDDNGEFMMIRRYDKNTPNWYNVYRNIITAYSSVSNSISHIMLTDVQSVSFTMRTMAYNRAINNGDNGHLIIDVGTGRYQSAQCIDLRSGPSIIFCDPELSPYPHPSFKRGMTDLTNMSEAELVNTMDMFHRRRSRYGTYRGKIENMLSSDRLRRFVAHNRISIVYCFSVQHCLDFISEMDRLGSHQTGVLYVYPPGMEVDANVFGLGADTEILSFIRKIDNGTSTIHVRIGNSEFVDPYITERTLGQYDIGEGMTINDLPILHSITQLKESARIIDMIRLI